MPALPLLLQPLRLFIVHVAHAVFTMPTASYKVELLSIPVCTASPLCHEEMLFGQNAITAR
jgi:hypothetical protein